MANELLALISHIHSVILTHSLPAPHSTGALRHLVQGGVAGCAQAAPCWSGFHLPPFPGNLGVHRIGSQDSSYHYLIALQKSLNTWRLHFSHFLKTGLTWRIYRVTSSFKSSCIFCSNVITLVVIFFLGSKADYRPVLQR